MRWLVPPLISSIVAIIVLFISWEFMGLAILGVILSDQRSLIALFASIFIPIASYSYLAHHQIEERYRKTSEEIRRLRNLIDAYQVVLNNINRDLDELKRELENRHMPAISRSIANLERRVVASEKLLSVLIELISSQSEKTQRG
jgi:Mg2+ and Co2+ transporter CorA